MTAELVNKTCTPCRGGIPPLTREQAERLHAEDVLELHVKGARVVSEAQHCLQGRCHLTAKLHQHSHRGAAVAAGLRRRGDRVIVTLKRRDFITLLGGAIESAADTQERNAAFAQTLQQGLDQRRQRTARSGARSKKTLQPHRRQHWVIPPKANSAFVAAMVETVLPACRQRSARRRRKRLVHHRSGKTNPNSTSSSSRYVFLRKPCRFRDPVALAFVWTMPDARSVRASATWGGGDSVPKTSAPVGSAPTGQGQRDLCAGLLDRHLQVLGRAERDLLAGLDLDGFAGRRISAHAGCARPDLQDAKTRNLDAFAFLEMFGDQGHEVA
jgi:hypothetical protein